VTSLDAPLLAVLERLEARDARERAEGVPHELRARQVARTTGQLLLALAAPLAGARVLELGGSRGYSTAWLAAGARVLGGGVTSVEIDPVKCEEWRRTIGDAGLGDWAELLEGDALKLVTGLAETFDLVFIDAEKEDYEALFAAVGPLLAPGALVVADNVLSHAETLGAYSSARQTDRALSSVTLPLDRGLELTSVAGRTLDERVRGVLARLEAEDEHEYELGLPPEQRSLAVGPDSGRVLFGVVAASAGCDVLELGASRGYSSVWLAAAARACGGSVVSLEVDPAKCEAWRRNIAAAGLEEWATLVEGDALETLPMLDEGIDVVFLDAWKPLYEPLFGLARERLGAGGLVIADNVVSHGEELAPYVAARKGDQTLVSVTVPVGSGLEVTCVLDPSAL
jgi:predicted O-methyltransferase YrrM